MGHSLKSDICTENCFPLVNYKSKTNFSMEWDMKTCIFGSLSSLISEASATEHSYFRVVMVKRRWLTMVRRLSKLGIRMQVLGAHKQQDKFCEWESESEEGQFPEQEKRAGEVEGAHCKLHYAICTTHLTIHTKYYKMHTAHCTLLSTHCALHTAHCTLHTTHYTLNTKH